MAAIPAPLVHRIVWLQLAIAFIATTLLLLVDGKLAMSVLIGAIVQVIPQAFFSRVVFRYSGARQTPAILMAFYKGESIKLVLTAVLFAVAFKYCEGLNYPAVFISFTVMIVIHGIYAAKLLNTGKKN